MQVIHILVHHCTANKKSLIHSYVPSFIHDTIRQEIENEWNDKTIEIRVLKRGEASTESLVSTCIVPKLLQSVQDNIFTVNFKKQASSESVYDKLMQADASSFTDAKKLA